MDNPSPALIELRQVSTSLGLFPVLSGFTLTVRQGQFINLHGPTGCGKTTVLRAVAGLARPAAGSVAVGGRDLSGLSGRDIALMRRRFGFMTREAMPPETEKLEQAVMLPAILAGYGTDEAQELAADALSLCGLSPLASERFGALSSGARQLALLALALVHQPVLVLADEPAANLDPEKASLALALLSQYARQGGTVLSVSTAPLPGSFAIEVDMEKLHHG